MTSTLELTHEQAAFIRVAILLNDWHSIPSDILPGGFYSGPDECDLEPKARAALAEYDARYKIIETAELERLQALERKIEAFLAALDLADYSIGVGSNIEVQWCLTRGNGWSVTKDGVEVAFYSTSKEAVRDGFELFEVPGVEAKS